MNEGREKGETMKVGGKAKKRSGERRKEEEEGLVIKIRYDETVAMEEVRVIRR